MRTACWFFLIALGLGACGDDGGGTEGEDAGPGPRDAGGGLDAAGGDAGPGDEDASTPTDAGPPDPAETRIQPWSEDAWYWQYEGEPVLLVGASDQDNLFQLDGLEAQLDALVAAGGNYVRNTMSSRDEGDLYPFASVGDGMYDLSSWNEDYWDRFERFLALTHERDVIVQIEVWDRFDHSRDPWIDDPYNPENNVNYDEAESGLATRYPNHPASNEQPFFHTPPTMDDNEVVRQYQEAFVDRMLSHTFEYDHVLYVMDNETDEAPEWPTYWAEHILAAAADAGVEVELTEMWDDRNITSSDQHQYTWDHRELFSFTDISQNNHQTGETHWNQILYVQGRLADAPMPMSSVKIYGADTGSYGTTADAVERFWRNLLGGMATSRFHRPDAGLGLSDTSAAQLTAARWVEERASFLALDPAQELLGDRSENEAYVAADPGSAYVVYFTDGDSVTLDLSDPSGSFEAAWISLADISSGSTETLAAGAAATLTAPGEGGWVAVITR